jgi:UDP-N-acetylmuramate dehydrogenase
VGGPARLLVDALTETDLAAALRFVRATRVPFLVLGGGTNLVVSDAGYDGVILRYRNAAIEIRGEIASAASGAALDELVVQTVDAGLAGLESMRRIPGWIGAAIYGNAGAYGQQINDTLRAVRVFDGEKSFRLGNADCGFVYRASRFKQNKRWVILSAEFALRTGDRSALRERAEQIRETRDAKFPPSMKCAGSIFKNLHFDRLPEPVQKRLPPSATQHGKVPAAWFLERVGAKGYADGGIRVADYHANLLYNAGGGTAAQITGVIDELKARVQREFGLILEEEVQYVGFPDRRSY